MRLMGIRLHEITEPIKDDRCDQCISEGRGPMNQRSRSASPRMETTIREGENLEETYQNVLILREEYAGKVDRLLNEATGKGAGSEVFDETRLTKIIQEDNEVMVLQLKQDENGPVWRQTQVPGKRRLSLLLMPVLRGGARPEGGLVVAGVANKRESNSLYQGDLICG